MGAFLPFQPDQVVLSDDETASGRDFLVADSQGGAAIFATKDGTITTANPDGEVLLVPDDGSGVTRLAPVFLLGGLGVGTQVNGGQFIGVTHGPHLHWQELDKAGNNVSNVAWSQANSASPSHMPGTPPRLSRQATSEDPQRQGKVQDTKAGLILGLAAALAIVVFLGKR